MKRFITRTPKDKEGENKVFRAKDATQKRLNVGKKPKDMIKQSRAYYA